MTLKNSILNEIEKEQMVERTDFSVGDTIVVYVKVIEGSKTRLQAYEGLVIARKSRGMGSSFKVLKQSHGVKVERTFPLYSRLIDSIEVKKKGIVRQAKIYYMRSRTGKAARLKEKKAN
jgi:large subunit ribosomal protein L19